MAQVLILVEDEWDTSGMVMPQSPDRGQMVSALMQAIASYPTAEFPAGTTIQVATPGASPMQLEDTVLVCPLTLHLPPELAFPQQTLYQLCQDIEGLRLRVEQQFGVPSGQGTCWLPIVLTAKGPLYAEVISAEGISAEGISAEGISADDMAADVLFPIGSSGIASSLRYYQPLHLPDRLRQPLYRLGGQLLRSLSAPAATYLLQFSIQDNGVLFDRLFPFPAHPAIASIGIQTPNLFTCHWRCLTGQPISDLAIPATVPFVELTFS